MTGTGDPLHRWEHALRRLWTAWSACSAHHEWREGASEGEIASAETAVGKRLPSELKALYRRSNGMNLLDGNLIVQPLAGRGPGGATGLVDLGDELRAHGWGIPGELVVFASDGSEALFGYWASRDSAEEDKAPVVMTDEPDDDPSMTIMGTSITGFLVGWTAYYVQAIGTGNEPLDVLEVPPRLRSHDPGDELLHECLAWANPELSDSYLPMSQDDLREMFR